MKRFLRLLSLIAVGLGSVLAGGAFYEGYRRGFMPDLELGNWDPVIQGAIGVLSVILGTVAYLYFGHAVEGLRRRQSFAKALRGAAVLLLVLCEMTGVFAAVSGFIIFLSLERSGANGVWALGVCVCGVIARQAAVYLLPWAKGQDGKPPKEPNSVASFDE